MKIYRIDTDLWKSTSNSVFQKPITWLCNKKQVLWVESNQVVFAVLISFYLESENCAFWNLEADSAFFVFHGQAFAVVFLVGKKIIGKLK